MKSKKYNLIFKTGDAELRALNNNSFDTSAIFPIIELTRGRKSKYDKVGSISKRIDKISSIFSNQEICLDLTTSEDLSNEEISDLYNCNNGYSTWINFLVDLKEENLFSNLIPTILVDTSDENLDENLLKQVEGLSKSFKHLLYRHNINDTGYFDDLNVIKDYLNKNDLEFTFLFDCEYIPVGAFRDTIAVLDARIEKIKQIIPKANFIVASTSFPRYVSDIGNDEMDIFPLIELLVYEGIADKDNVEYGDYGSINPTRNDSVSMSRGWIPRIDVPTLDGIYYYRLRRNKFGNDYAKTYSAVARKVIDDNKFPNDYNKNWGVKQINICAKEGAPGSAPSFWISVRMSIFIEMQIRRLKS